MDVIRVVVVHLFPLPPIWLRFLVLVCLWLSRFLLWDSAYTGYPPPPPDGDGERVSRLGVSFLPVLIPVAVQCQSTLSHPRCEWEGQQHTPEYREWLRRRRDTQNLMSLLSFVSPMRLLASLLPQEDSTVPSLVRRRHRRCGD